jgi:hypothetical protein
MQCSGITSEDYYLWPLGLTDETESDRIRKHLAEGCGSCIQAVRESVEFWSVYGATASFEADLSPSPQVRTRLLEAIERERKPIAILAKPAVKELPAQRPRFVFAVAGVAAAVLVAAIGWQVTRQPAAPARVANQSSAQLEELNRQILDLQAKLNVAEREVDDLRAVPATPNGPVTPVQPATLRQDPNPQFGDLGKALADANAQIQQLKAALAGEQAKAARLAQDFDQQTGAIATLTLERRDAEANLSAAMARLAERDRQIKTLNAKITTLEHDNDRLNDAITNQKGKVAHAVRLVSLLSTPSTKFVRLTGTAAAPNASGYAILAEGNRLIFTAGSLPNLKNGKVYQLWLIRGKNPGIVSGGIFEGGTDQVTIEFTDPAMLSGVKALAVTDEPKGGSPLPTGHKMLIGTAKS